jgi:hypothetical protein
MNKNRDLRELGGGFVSLDQNVRTFQPPQHATSVNGQTQNDDAFDDFMEEIIMTSDEPVADEEDQAPVEVAENLNETLESPSEAPVVKKKSGRKARKTEDLHASVEMIAKKHAIHEPKILEITFKSMLEKALLELMVREILGAHEIHEDSAPALLVYMWDKAPMLEGRKTYLDTLQQTAEGAGIGYSNVQKLTKKLLEKGLLTKEPHGLGFSTLLEDFFASLTDNKQILLTFEHLQDEQMESITENSEINEEMANDK